MLFRLLVPTVLIPQSMQAETLGYLPVLFGASGCPAHTVEARRSKNWCGGGGRDAAPVLYTAEVLPSWQTTHIGTISQYCVLWTGWWQKAGRHPTMCPDEGGSPRLSTAQPLDEYDRLFALSPPRKGAQMDKGEAERLDRAIQRASVKWIQVQEITGGISQSNRDNRQAARSRCLCAW